MALRAKDVAQDSEDRVSHGNPFNDPCSYYTRTPSRCPQGNSLWSDAELLDAVPRFAKLYDRRPLRRNHGGVDVNHAFALWFSVQRIKPKYIVESGVHMGFTTWLLRAAAPDAQIFCIDPNPEGKTHTEKNHTHFHDNNPKTRYFRAENFKDLNALDWDSLIPASERHLAFVALDDHMSALRRSVELFARGFVHLWYDDNWVNGDCYSFNQLCSDPAPDEDGHILMKDQFGRQATAITLADYEAHSKWLQEHMETYFEFPALFDGCEEHTRRRSLLREEDLERYGLPTVEEDWQHYQHLYSPYVKLGSPRQHG